MKVCRQHRRKGCTTCGREQNTSSTGSDGGDLWMPSSYDSGSYGSSGCDTSSSSSYDSGPSSCDSGGSF
jgi:hypothetical protein